MPNPFSRWLESYRAKRRQKMFDAQHCHWLRTHMREDGRWLATMHPAVSALAARHEQMSVANWHAIGFDSIDSFRVELKRLQDRYDAQRIEPYTDQLADLQAELRDIRAALGVEYEPHQSLRERTHEAIDAKTSKLDDLTMYIAELRAQLGATFNPGDTEDYMRDRTYAVIRALRDRPAPPAVRRTRRASGNPT